MQLSHDENFSAGPNQVVAGLKLQVNLDSNGNIPVSPATKVWSNDVLTPTGSVYYVRAFKADGTEAWASPQVWNLSSSPNPIDVGTIPPLSPPGSGLSGGGSGLLLETNGTVNTNQSLLNLANGSNVTITNSAGTTTINASGGPSFNTSGQGGFWSAGLNVSGIGGTTATTVTVSPVANQITAIQFELFAGHTIRTVSCFVITSVGSSSANFGVYNASGAKLLDSGAIATTSGGAATVTITPVILPPGVYYFAQSADHNSVQLAGFTISSGGVQLATGQAAATGVYIGIATNSTSGGVLPATLGTISFSTWASNSTNMAGAFFGV